MSSRPPFLWNTSPFLTHTLLIVWKKPIWFPPKRFTLAQIQLNARSDRCPIFPICLYERKTFRNRRLMITTCIDSEFVRHKLHSKFINGRRGGLMVSALDSGSGVRVRALAGALRCVLGQDT